MRIAVLGGGGFRTPLIFDALAGYEPDAFVLYDTDPARADVIASVLDDPRVAVAESLPQALDGADVVISAVRVGGADGRVRDERGALELGLIGQETVGAGGLSYALRSLPVAREQALSIARYAPGAWTLSMTNPAGIVTEVMAEILGSRVIGICDSPTGLVRRVCAALDVPLETPGTVPAGVDYLGINHLGWLRAVSSDGQELLPRFVRDPRLLATTEEGRLFGAPLLGALGSVPNEYLYWFYARDEALAGIRAAGRTRGEHVRDRQRPFYASAAADPRHARELWRAANDERNRSYFAELRDGERDETDVAAGGYETVAAAALGALLGRTPPQRMILNVAAPVPGIADGTVVEVPCLVHPLGVTPQSVSPPSEHECGLMAQVRHCERAAASAALTGSSDAALRAFALHPLVGSIEAATRLVAEWRNAGTPDS